MNLRSILALWAGKAIILVSRLLGKGGSTFPGRVACKLSPDVLTRMAAQSRLGNVVVTGTNGKTTTSRMISAVASLSGVRVTNNRSGANLIYGVTSAFIQSCDLAGRLRADLGVIEVDEATMPAATTEVRARRAVVTNFFRDQLDRFGELATTVLLVKRGLQVMPAGSFAALNADDPLVASLGRDCDLDVAYYGVEDRSLFTGDGVQAADVKNCLLCGSPYEYDGVFYAHVGIYRCPSCGYQRPDPQVRLVRYQPLGATSHLAVETPAGDLVLPLPVPGLYNAYNALAATACCLSLGFSLDDIRAGLEGYAGSFGRMESIRIGDKSVLLALVKNPAGFNEVIRTVVEGPGRKHVVICINDNYADGTDVSWLWDVDFERFAGGANAESIITSGIRAEDMAVRLKYAGVDTSALRIENDLKRALEIGLERTAPGSTLYVLPTYTAMLEMREIIHRMGYARMFWND
ncbi:MAG: Mur ligase family protein [Firmicutes bacterium]|nr:Mur ligase family protein [Bacillota bacterium]